ncbi:MAG: GNAT family N-acetyltransferase [Gemmatimonadales bacterium]
MAERATIRLAATADAAALADFAERCFRDTFGPDNRAEDMDYYVATTFGAEYQRADIAEPRGAVFLLEWDSAIVGYAQLRRGCACIASEAVTSVELKRFYVASAWHGHGLAQRLMQRALRYASECGADVIWLAVWEHNPRAISFYRKFGFAEIGRQSFLLGSDDQTDMIMSRAVRE